ncbi:response regulator transcription factor [Rhizobium sp. KVB221]|uniref:Response regulator transcription factor n=1 Tax=Rhizobium setariae TaxID=2801340 RepID=A0A937CQI9_9HYPH|nr:response regulator transcription factor [Rhizobium setariae]MBL0373973.1 response regulator transcription factor [Rhizobium setariae]
MKILLIEDDRKIAEHVTKGFAQAGHACDVSDNGQEALRKANSESYDVFIVDRMVPGLDGLSFVTAIRAANIDAPAIFLTSIGGIDDRVEGLDAGGDDYLVKPFAFAELIARVNALARRLPASDQKTVLKVCDLELDLVKRKATRAGQVIELQPREFTLLEVLMRAEGRIMTRAMLLELVWDFHFDPKTSVVETHISRLRTKIDKPFGVPLLHTIKNTGYTLHVPQ